MPKAASPVRLEGSLMEAAALTGAISHRSAAEQVEYWADIGRKVSGVITPENLIAIKSGLLNIRLEQALPVTADPEAVFSSLDRDRESGALGEAVAAGSIRYQASSANPGLLEQVHPDGAVVTGRFVNGEFEPLS